MFDVTSVLVHLGRSLQSHQTLPTLSHPLSERWLWRSHDSNDIGGQRQRGGDRARWARYSPRCFSRTAEDRLSCLTEHSRRYRTLLARALPLHPNDNNTPAYDDIHPRRQASPVGLYRHTLRAREWWGTRATLTTLMDGTCSREWRLGRCRLWARARATRTC